jgi:ABC-type bacteriocin/lantibiotic exporter with double-glycine peptidase domain
VAPNHSPIRHSRRPCPQEWRLTLTLMAAVVVPLLLEAGLAVYSERLSERLMELQGAQAQLAEEQLSAARTVKALGQEAHAQQLYARAAHATFAARWRLALVSNPLEGLVDASFSAGLLYCFWLGAAAALSGSLSKAFLISFFILATNLRDNMGKIFRMVREPPA